MRKGLKLGKELNFIKVGFLEERRDSFVWFCGFADSHYTQYLNTFVSFNGSLPPYYSYEGSGACRSSYYNSVPSSGVSVVSCVPGPRYSYTLLTVGRYVTVMPYIESRWGTLWTICEVTVTGVRQNIDADGIA